MSRRIGVGDRRFAVNKPKCTADQHRLDNEIGQAIVIVVCLLIERRLDGGTLHR